MAPSDSCAAYLGPTDTGLAFTGEAEWVIPGLMVLGIPKGQAYDMYQQIAVCEPGMVLDADESITVGVRVCQRCVEASGAGMTVGLMATGIPAYSQRS